MIKTKMRRNKMSQLKTMRSLSMNKRKMTANKMKMNKWILHQKKNNNQSFRDHVANLLQSHLVHSHAKNLQLRYLVRSPNSRQSQSLRSMKVRVDKRKMKIQMSKKDHKKRLKRIKRRSIKHLRRIPTRKWKKKRKKSQTQAKTNLKCRNKIRTILRYLLVINLSQSRLMKTTAQALKSQVIPRYLTPLKKRSK